MKGSQREKVLGELGATWVTYKLVCNGWDVYRKINEKGCDLLATRDGKTKFIEVKSLDLPARSGKNKKYVYTGLSPAQRDRADYIAIYLHGPNKCLIIPATNKTILKNRDRNGNKVGNWENDSFIPIDEFCDYFENFNIK